MAESDFPPFAKDPDESFWVLQSLDEVQKAFIHPDLTSIILLENCGKYSHLIGSFSKGQLQFYFVELLNDNLSQPKSLNLMKITESPSAQLTFEQFALKEKDTPSMICIAKSSGESDNLAENEVGKCDIQNQENNLFQSNNQTINNQSDNEDYFSSFLNNRSKKTTKKAPSQTEFFQVTIGISMERMVHLFKVDFNKNKSQSWEISQVEMHTCEYNGQIIQSLQLSENGQNILCSVIDPTENLVSLYVENTKDPANRCLVGSFNQNKEVLIGRIAASSDMSIIRAFVQIAQNKQMYIYTFYFDPNRQQLQTLNRLPITTSLSQQSNLLRSANPTNNNANAFNLNSSCSLFSETCGVGIMSDGCSLEIHDFNAHSSKPVLKESSTQIYNFDSQTLLVANSTRNISTSYNNTTTPINTPNTINPIAIQSSSLALYSYNAPYSALEYIPLPSYAKVHNVLLCQTNSTFEKSDRIDDSSLVLILAVMADEQSTITPIIIDTTKLQDKLPELQTVGSQITLFSSRIDFDNFPQKNIFKTPEASKMSNNFFNFQIFSSLGLSLSQNVEYPSPEKPSRQTQSQELSQGNQSSKMKSKEQIDTEQRQNRLLFTENSINHESSKYAIFDEEHKEFLNQEPFSSQHSFKFQKQKVENECLQYHKEDEDNCYEEEGDSIYENGEDINDLDQESNAFCSNSSDSKGECEKCRLKKHKSLKKKILKSHNYHNQHSHHQYSQNSSNDIIVELSQSQPLNSDDLDYEEINEPKSKPKIISYPIKKSKKVPRSKKRTSCGYFDSEGELQQQDHEFSFNDLSNSPCKSASPVRQQLSPLKTKKKPFSFSLNMVSPPTVAKSISGSSSTLPALENSKDFFSLEQSNSFVPHQLLVKRKISPNTRLSNFSQQHLQSKAKLLHFS